MIYQIKNYHLCVFDGSKILRIHEDFVEYYELPDIKKDTTVTAMKDSLIRAS